MAIAAQRRVVVFLTFLVVAGASGLLAGLPAIAQVEVPEAESKVCPAAPDGSIVVDLSSSYYLATHREEARASSPFYPATIPAGVYNIRLTSYDNHVTSDGVVATQPNEQYQVEGFFAEELVFASAPISDLPDDDNLLTEWVGFNVSVPDLDSIRAHHPFYPDTTSQNSIEPVCAVFVPVNEVSVSVSGSCEWSAETGAVFTYTVTASDGVTVDFDGGAQDVVSGGTYTSSSGSVSWTATAPEGSVFANNQTTESGTAEVADCTPPPPTTTTTTGPPLGALGDKVWADNDADGIQDAGELGIAGVLVTLRDGSGVVLATDTTDSDGNYLFTGLPAGNYVVQFGLPDLPVVVEERFTAPDQGGDDATDSDANADGRTGNIALGVGEVNLTVDAGVYGVIVEGTVVTTIPPVSPSTLPFTGFDGQDGLIFGLVLVAAGGLVLFAAAGRREEKSVAVVETMGGWSNH